MDRFTPIVPFSIQHAQSEQITNKLKEDFHNFTPGTWKVDSRDYLHSSRFSDDSWTLVCEAFSHPSLNYRVCSEYGQSRDSLWVEGLKNSMKDEHKEELFKLFHKQRAATLALAKSVQNLKKIEAFLSSFFVVNYDI